MGDQLRQSVTEYELMMRAQQVALGQLLDRQAREDLSATETARYLSYLSHFKSLASALVVYRSYEKYECYMTLAEQEYSRDAYLLGYDKETLEYLPPERDALLQDITAIKIALTAGKGRAKKEAYTQLNNLFWEFVDKEEYRNSGDIYSWAGDTFYSQDFLADRDFKLQFVEESFSALRFNPYSEPSPAVDKMTEHLEKGHKMLTQAQKFFTITVFTFMKDIVDSIQLI